MALYVSVKKEGAQKILLELKKEMNIDRTLRVFEKGGEVFIPILKKIKGAFELENENGKYSRNLGKPKSVEEALALILPKDELAKVVNSFDIIGDIAMLEIPESLVSKEEEIAKAVCIVHRNVKVVAKKEGPMEGAFRTRKMSVIYGEKRTETIYVESGAKMKIDIAKVYFSPRLSFERKRIEKLVKDGENILALFAGVGPFPLVIAKKKKCNIVAIELNPEGVRYMRINAKLNKAKMEIIEGDVNAIVPEKYAGFADRVIMPLPKDAEEFLQAAYVGSRDRAIIHFYTFADIARPFEEAHEKIYRHLDKSKVEIAGERIVRPFSPRQVQVVVDLRVRKK